MEQEKGGRVRRILSAADGLAFFFDAVPVLGGAREREETRAAAARLVVEAFADYCFVDLSLTEKGLIDRLVLSDMCKASGAYEQRYHYRYKPGVRQGTPKVIMTGEPDIETKLGGKDEEPLRRIAPGDEDLEALVSIAPISYVCVPMRVCGQTIGAMGLVAGSEEQPYTHDDLLLVRTLADCTSLAIMSTSSHYQEPVQVSVPEPPVQQKSQNEEPVPGNGRLSSSNLSPPLSSKQLEALRLLDEGLPDKQIAKRMSLRETTIRYHIQILYQKLKVNSRGEAVSRARQLEIL